MSESERNPGAVYFGPRTLGVVRLSDINELQQVRTSYNPEGIAELADSMIVDPEVEHDPQAIADEAFNLSNPVIVAYFPKDSQSELQSFLEDHASMYSQDTQHASQLVAAEDGSTTLLIGGHRRKRALYQLAERCGIQPSRMEVAANVHENISFAEALRLQLSENVHERPPVQDEARAIERFYQDVVRQHGTEPSIKQFAVQLGFSETKVRDALAFARLPSELQELTEKGLLSYSLVRRFKPLQDVYANLYTVKHGDSAIQDGATREEYIRDSLMVDAARLIKNRLDGNEVRAAAYIDGLVKSVKDMIGTPEPLFELEMMDTPAGRRMHASRMVSRTAIETARRALEWQASTGDLDVDSITTLRDRLDELVAAAKAQAVHAQAFELDMLFDEQTK